MIAFNKRMLYAGIASIFLIGFLFLVVFPFISGFQQGASANEISTTLQPTPTIGAAGVVGIVGQPTGVIGDPDELEAQKLSQAIDYTNPTVQNFATEQIQKSHGGTNTIQQISDVWQSIYNQWTYVSDPPDFNYFRPASETISDVDLKGNCVDYAIINSAVIESIGGSSRIITACPPGGGICHAYAEYYISNNYGDLQLTTDLLFSRYDITTVYYHTYAPSGSLGTQYWLNLDWQASYPGGEFFQDDGSYKIFYPNGAYDVITNSESTILAQSVSPGALAIASAFASTPEPTPNAALLALKSALASNPTPTPTPNLALLALKNLHK